MGNNITSDSLYKIYGIYDEFIKNFEISCKIGCSCCCTCNVTITTFEGYPILSYLQKNKNLSSSSITGFFKNKKRFEPKLTINHIAELSIKGENIPEEENNPDWGKCPFLSDDKCEIYQVRPFMCRSLISEHDCKKNGYALIDPLILTVNNIFLQYIEHIDFKGYFGNLADILIILSKTYNIDSYAKQSLRLSEDNSVIPNRKSKVLIIPQEDRDKVQPLLKALDRVIKLYSDN